MPWTSFDNKLSIYRSIAKTLLTASLIFDKGAVHKAEIELTAFAILAFILLNRFRYSLYYNYRVHLLQTTLDIFLAYHAFFIPLHILINSRQSVSTVFIFMLNSLVFSVAYGVTQERLRVNLLAEENYI